MPLPATTGRMVRRLLLAVTFLAIVIVAGPAAQQSSAQSSPVSIPAWVPIYPGARVDAPRSARGRVERTMWFNIMTSDSCERVVRFYEEKLNLAGFSLVKGFGDQDGCTGVQAHNAPGSRKVNLTGGMVVRENRGRPVKVTEYEVEVTELTDSGQSGPQGNGVRQENGSTHSAIPQWVPSYPRAVPRNISAKQSGREYFLSFTFTTTDNAQSILSWYQDRLRQSGFTVNMDVFGTNGALRSNTRDNSRALKIEVSAAGGQNVALFEVREQR